MLVKESNEIESEFIYLATILMNSILPLIMTRCAGKLTPHANVD